MYYVSIVLQGPENYIGDLAKWEKAETALKEALLMFGMPWKVLYLIQLLHTIKDRVWSLCWVKNWRSSVFPIFKWLLVCDCARLECLRICCLCQFKVCHFTYTGERNGWCWSWTKDTYYCIWCIRQRTSVGNSSCKWQSFIYLFYFLYYPSLTFYYL